MPQDAPPSSQRHEDQTQDSGWSTVGRKSRRGKRVAKPQNEAPRETPPPRTTNLRPVEELDADYRKLRAQFEDEDCCRRLRELVSKNAASTRHISKAINLGVGSFDPLDLSWPAKRATYVQLISFLVMVEELEKITGQRIKCIFQEPAFTQSDKDFITSLGHEVVETPSGCNMVDEHSFLFAIHLYRPVYAMALRGHLPAVFVGTGWSAWENMLDTDGLEEMQEMDRIYRRCDFPQDSYGYAFSSTSIYWKPTAEDTKNSEADSPRISTLESGIIDKLKSTTLL